MSIDPKLRRVRRFESCWPCVSLVIIVHGCKFCGFTTDIKLLLLYVVGFTVRRQLRHLIVIVAFL